MLSKIFNEILVKELNLNKGNLIDEDIVMKFLDMKAPNTIWMTQMRINGRKCLNDTIVKRNEIIKTFEKAPFTIKMDQCNVIFHYLVHCISFEQLKVNISRNRRYFLTFIIQKCPKEVWSNEDRCVKGRAFLEKCGGSIPIIMTEFSKRIYKKV